jgi:hypothetical protein
MKISKLFPNENRLWGGMMQKLPDDLPGRGEIEKNGARKIVPEPFSIDSPGGGS